MRAFASFRVSSRVALRARMEGPPWLDPRRSVGGSYGTADDTAAPLIVRGQLEVEASAPFESHSSDGDDGSCAAPCTAAASSIPAFVSKDLR